MGISWDLLAFYENSMEFSGELGIHQDLINKNRDF